MLYSTSQPSRCCASREKNYQHHWQHTPLKASKHNSQHSLVRQKPARHSTGGDRGCWAAYRRCFFLLWGPRSQGGWGREAGCGKGGYEGKRRQVGWYVPSGRNIYKAQKDKLEKSLRAMRGIGLGQWTLWTRRGWRCLVTWARH